MFETPFTIVGNIVTDPVHRRVGEQEVFKFRVASNSRRRTAEGNMGAGQLAVRHGELLGQAGDRRRCRPCEGRSGDRRRTGLHQRVRRPGRHPAVIGRGARDLRRAGSVAVQSRVSRPDEQRHERAGDRRSPTESTERPPSDGRRFSGRGRRAATERLARSGHAYDGPRAIRELEKGNTTAWPNSSTRCGRSARRTATRSSLTTSP